MTALSIPEFLLARPLAELVPVRDGREPLRVLVASLARGGAERIVLDWLSAERRHGREVELAVLHSRAHAYRAPPGIRTTVRAGQPPEEFLDALAARWRRARSPVSVHLVPDALLARLWQADVATVPVVHNSREGWRNDPGAWRQDCVPLAMACADAVRDQMIAAGCRVPVIALKHRPVVGDAAKDPQARIAIRESLEIGNRTLLVGAVGAFKAQKDFVRAVEVLAALLRMRDAALVILGGVLDDAGLAELDRVAAAAARLGVAARLRLPGFVDPIEPWYAACDVLLNVSRHEGLSIATQEALCAGLPVVATDVGGQREVVHERLCLLAPGTGTAGFARRLAECRVRTVLACERPAAQPRSWTLATSWRRPQGSSLDTLFVTANLNAGGAQRSLVNLAGELAGSHRLAIAVCAQTTHPAFPERLAATGVEHFRPSQTADPFDVAESLLGEATARMARTVCMWNVDARVKLLLARFAPPALRLIDVCPGDYAFREIESQSAFSGSLGLDVASYHARLDVLVLKYAAGGTPACRRVEVVPNGVALRGRASARPSRPRFLVSGRLAPSKRLELIIEAFAIVTGGHHGAELDIVGQAEPRHEDYAARLVAACASLPVRFRGAQPGLDFLSEPFTAAVVLGTHQGSPNAVLEAMAAGLPVIANDSGGTRELVSGRTGWLLPEACTAAELAQAMRESIDDEAPAVARGAAGRELVAARHSLAAMAQQYRKILQPAIPATPA
jgi:glycosyltransferase involved in cell wall biosynthesis